MNSPISQAGSSAPSIWGALLFAVTVAATASVIWTTGAVHQHSQLVDTVAYLDAVWRVYVGQAPHRDFHTLVGALPFGVTAWLMSLTRADADSLAYANAFFFVLLCGLGWPLLRARYGDAVAAFACLGLGAILVAPRMLGYDLDLTTYAINYNRLGWAFLGLVGLVVLSSRRDGAPTRRAEWLILGLVSAGLFYLKINFGLVGFAAILGLWLREGRPLSAPLWSGLGVLALYSLCRFAWNVELSAYWHDIRVALSVNSNTTYGKRAWDAILDNVESVAILLIQALVAWPLARRLFAAETPAKWFVAGLLAALPAFFLVAVTNTHKGPIPILAVVGFALAEWVRRRVGSTGVEVDVLRHRVLVLLSVFLLGLVALPDLYASGRATAWHWLKQRSGQQSPHLDGVFASMALPLQLSEDPSKLAAAIAARPAHHFGLTSAEYKAHTDDGLALLRAHGAASGKVLSMDFINPFHLALATVPARGDWICWDPNAVFSPSTHISPDELFRDVTAVLVPKRSFCMGFADAKLEIYSPVLIRDFREEGETALWKLWIRKNPLP